MVFPDVLQGNGGLEVKALVERRLAADEGDHGVMETFEKV